MTTCYVCRHVSLVCNLLTSCILFSYCTCLIFVYILSLICPKCVISCYFYTVHSYVKLMFITITTCVTIIQYLLTYIRIIFLSFCSIYRRTSLSGVTALCVVMSRGTVCLDNWFGNDAFWSLFFIFVSVNQN